MLKTRIFRRDFVRVKVCGIPEDSWQRVKPQINLLRLWDDIHLWCLRASQNTVSHTVAKNSQVLRSVMWQGNVPNTTDFLSSYKIYTAFHVSGCFKFKVTFHNVFLFLMSISIWNGFVEYKNQKTSMISVGNRTCNNNMQHLTSYPLTL